MRVTLLALLGILRLASSGPHGPLPHSVSAVLSVASLATSTGKSADVSSPGSRKCPTKTVTHEKTVITIDKIVETETIDDPKCACSDDNLQCQNCPKRATTTPESTTTPTVSTTTPEPTTTPTVPTTTPESTTTPTVSATTPEPTTTPTVPTTTPEPTTTPTASTIAPDSFTLPNEICSVKNCKPPRCTCMSTDPPGGLDVKDMPQFVMLTFDDAVTEENTAFYRELLGGLRRKNKASGCAIAATFFVSGEYTDYPSVNELYTGGNEIALHSISHKTSPDYWNGLDTAGWEREVVSQRRMMEKYANVPAEDIKGIRGPFLFTGGDEGFRMLHRHFEYDCTLIHNRVTPANAPIFPYTLDFGFQRDCVVEKCPRDAYPGLWSMPLNTLLMGKEMGGDDTYRQCAMADACTPQPITAHDTFQYLKANFENFYNLNRAPFPIFLHEAWLHEAERKEGYLRFVDWLLEKEDVYLVTVSEVLDFMRDPKPKASYTQRRCVKDQPKSTCPQKRTCEYPDTPKPREERHMRICGTTCPRNYPWVDNPDGN